MYGKIFESIYDGTLADHWQALITFQQMIVLCDSQGVIDMTPAALSRRTGIPIEHINAGIEILEKPDPHSKTPGEDGRRIVLLDDHRPWGWRIVNHAIYKKMASHEDKKKADRERIAAKRKKSQEIADGRKVSQDVTDVAHTDADADADTNKKTTAPPGQPSADPPRNKKSRHFKNQINTWFSAIITSCKKLDELSAANGKKFNPYQWVQLKANQRGHPGAIDESLLGLINMWDAADRPWAYIEQIFKTKNGNWNERDAIKIHEQFKKLQPGRLSEFTHGLLKEI